MHRSNTEPTWNLRWQNSSHDASSKELGITSGICIHLKYLPRVICFGGDYMNFSASVNISRLQKDTKGYKRRIWEILWAVDLVFGHDMAQQWTNLQTQQVHPSTTLHVAVSSSTGSTLVHGPKRPIDRFYKKNWFLAHYNGEEYGKLW